MDTAIQSVQGMQAASDVAIDRAMNARMKMPGANLSMTAIDRTAKEFEGMFMSQMLQPMFEGIGVNPMFGGGHGEEVMRGFLVQEYGKMLAKNSRSGIADAVKKEMIKAQTAAQVGAYETAQKTGGVHNVSR